MGEVGGLIGALRNLRNYRFSDADTAEDVRGSSVYGRDDEKLGKIDDVIFDHSSGNMQYVVIDTGGWLSSKKFIVPPDRLRASAKHEDDFQMTATKKQIEAFPLTTRTTFAMRIVGRTTRNGIRPSGMTARCNIAKVQTATSRRRPTRCRPNQARLAATFRRVSRRN